MLQPFDKSGMKHCMALFQSLILSTKREGNRLKSLLRPGQDRNLQTSCWKASAVPSELTSLFSVKITFMCMDCEIIMATQIFMYIIIS